MKKFSKILFIALTVSLFTAVKSSAQIEVSIRPAVPRAYVVARRPPPPSRNHVWVEAEWRTVGGRYTYVPGYWSLPPRGHHRWIPGFWRTNRNRRQVWVRGHWA